MVLKRKTAHNYSTGSLLLGIFLLLGGCQSGPVAPADTRFRAVPATESGVAFVNQLTPD